MGDKNREFSIFFVHDVFDQRIKLTQDGLEDLPVKSKLEVDYEPAPTFRLALRTPSMWALNAGVPYEWNSFALTECELQVGCSLPSPSNECEVRCPD